MINILFFLLPFFPLTRFSPVLYSLLPRQLFSAVPCCVCAPRSHCSALFFVFWNCWGPIDLCLTTGFFFSPLQLHFGSSCTFPVRSVIGKWRSGLGKIRVIWEQGNRDMNYLWFTDYWWFTDAHTQTHSVRNKYTQAHIYTYPQTTSYLQSEENYKRLLCADLVGGQVLPVCAGIYTVKWWSSTDSCNCLPWNIHKQFCASGSSLLLKMHLYPRMSSSTTFFLIFVLAKKWKIELIPSKYIYSNLLIR